MASVELDQLGAMREVEAKIFTFDGARWLFIDHANGNPNYLIAKLIGLVPSVAQPDQGTFPLAPESTPPAPENLSFATEDEKPKKKKEKK